MAIPTLSTTAFLLAIVLLIVAAKWAGLNRAKFGNIVGVLAVCIVASGAFTIKLISDSYGGGGGGANYDYLSSADGGSVPIANGVLNIFENTSGRDQRIVSITLDECPDNAKGVIEGVSQCVVNAVVSTGENGLCYTDCTPISPP